MDRKPLIPDWLLIILFALSVPAMAIIMAAHGRLW
jgi:hypothetical protein